MMYNYVVSIAVLFSIYSVLEVRAVEVAKCKEEDLRLSEEQMFMLKNCVKEAGLAGKNLDQVLHSGCFLKCAMMARGLIDANGKPHKENIEKAIDENMPAFAIAPWKAEMEKCMDNEGLKLDVSKNDKECMTFIPFAGCVHIAYKKLCI